MEAGDVRCRTEGKLPNDKVRCGKDGVRVGETVYLNGVIALADKNDG